MDLQSLVTPSTQKNPDESNISCLSCETDNKRCFQAKEKAFALNYVPNAVIQYDQKQHIIWANKAASVLSDMSIKQIIGSHCCHAILDCVDNCLCPVKKAFQCSVQCTAEVKTKSGRIFTITALPFFDTDGEVESVIEIINDQTESDIIGNILSSKNSEVIAFSEKLPSLTSRECEVLGMVVNGKSNKIMSQELCISPKTIEIHRSRVMKKLDVNSLAELVQLNTIYEFYNQHIPFAL